MKNKVDEILEIFHKKEIDLIEVQKEFMSLLNQTAKDSFDLGFNISHEKFNASWRDDLELFDEEDLEKYDKLKDESLGEYFNKN